MTERTLIADEAAKHTRLTVDVLRALADQGKIPHFKVGRKYYFVESLLDAWLVESALQKASLSTRGKTRKAGGRTSRATGNELSTLLAPKTARKPNAKRAAVILSLVRKSSLATV